MNAKEAILCAGDIVFVWYGHALLSPGGAREMPCGWNTLFPLLYTLPRRPEIEWFLCVQE